MFQLNVRGGYAKYFENIISKRDLVAIGCEDKDDIKVLFKKLRDDMKLNINIIHIRATRSLEFESPPISELSEFGFNHFLLELIDGPVSILNHLCRTNHIQMIPIGTDHTLRVADQVPAKYSMFFTRKLSIIGRTPLNLFR